MLITLKRGTDILRCEERQLKRYLEKGWTIYVEPEEAPPKNIYHRETSLVSMVKDGNIRLCTVNQAARMREAGWKEAEGNDHGEHEHEGDLGGSGEPEGDSSPAEERGADLGEPGSDSGPGGPEAGSHDEPPEGGEDLEDEQTVKVREALLSLDPKNDDHWTGLGLPRVNVVEKIVGVPELRKADLEKAIPGFKRPE